jgi:uncharacterized protein YjbI with pentapeptide repeats
MIDPGQATSNRPRKANLEDADPGKPDLGEADLKNANLGSVVG